MSVLPSATGSFVCLGATVDHLVNVSKMCKGANTSVYGQMLMYDVLWLGAYVQVKMLRVGCRWKVMSQRLDLKVKISVQLSCAEGVRKRFLESPSESASLSGRESEGARVCRF